MRLVEGKDLKSLTFVVFGLVGEGREGATDGFSHRNVGDVAQGNIVLLLVAVIVVLLELVTMWGMGELGG